MYRRDRLIYRNKKIDMLGSITLLFCIVLYYIKYIKIIYILINILYYIFYKV